MTWTQKRRSTSAYLSNMNLDLAAVLQLAIYGLQFLRPDIFCTLEH